MSLEVRHLKPLSVAGEALRISLFANEKQDISDFEKSISLPSFISYEEDDGMQLLLAAIRLGSVEKMLLLFIRLSAPSLIFQEGDTKKTPLEMAFESKKEEMLNAIMRITNAQQGRITIVFNGDRVLESGESIAHKLLEECRNARLNVATQALKII